MAWVQWRCQRQRIRSDSRLITCIQVAIGYTIALAATIAVRGGRRGCSNTVGRPGVEADISIVYVFRSSSHTRSRWRRRSPASGSRPTWPGCSGCPWRPSAPRCMARRCSSACAAPRRCLRRQSPPRRASWGAFSLRQQACSVACSMCLQIARTVQLAALLSALNEYAQPQATIQYFKLERHQSTLSTVALRCSDATLITTVCPSNRLHPGPCCDRNRLGTGRTSFVQVDAGGSRTWGPRRRACLMAHYSGPRKERLQI